MDEFIKLLDEILDYVSYEIIDNTIYIHVVSNRNKCTCPYCGEDSFKVHSKYIRKFQDLPIQNKKIRNYFNK